MKLMEKQNVKAVCLCIGLGVLFMLSALGALAQNVKYKVWNPASDARYCLEGQGWRGTAEHFYDRLPAKANGVVRKEVWGLSRNSTGIQIRFKSDAKEIIVKYQTGGYSLQMPHMPAIGVSGLDLYYVHKDGKTERVNGRYSFKDTISYTFSFLQGAPGTEYVLYLPLYNSVKWLEFEIPEQSNLEPIPPRAKPIVLYGTSIAQGGCASRTGLAYTNIISRNLNKHMINLGFSGNGRMEPELIDLLAEIDAGVYVIDCLPNLKSSPELPSKIRYTVATLQKKRPGVPILFTEHCGTPIANVNEQYTDVVQINRQQRAVFDSLVRSGVKGLYYLTKEEINLDENSVVDYVHPNDVGMIRYADAYTKVLKEILKK